MCEETTVIGSGYNTYEASRSVAMGGWSVWRLGNDCQAYEGNYKTFGAAMKQARKLAGIKEE